MIGWFKFLNLNLSIKLFCNQKQIFICSIFKRHLKACNFSFILCIFFLYKCLSLYPFTSIISLALIMSVSCVKMHLNEHLQFSHTFYNFLAALKMVYFKPPFTKEFFFFLYRQVCLLFSLFFILYIVSIKRWHIKKYFL